MLEGIPCVTADLTKGFNLHTYSGYGLGTALYPKNSAGETYGRYPSNLDPARVAVLERAIISYQP